MTIVVERDISRVHMYIIYYVYDRCMYVKSNVVNLAHTSALFFPLLPSFSHYYRSSSPPPTLIRLFTPFDPLLAYVYTYDLAIVNVMYMLLYLLTR